MANNEGDNNNNFQRHLESVEGREIVFCHMCNSQWYRNEHGLICPSCEGDITEIISADSDPRPPPPRQRPSPPPEFNNLRQHYPFHPYADDSDPEEADIDEHIRHTPDGYTFTRTTHSSSPLRDTQNRRRGVPEEDVMGNFQSMIANLIGPQSNQTTPGGSSGVHTFTFGGGAGGPHVHGTRWTFSTGGPNRGYEQHSGDGMPPEFGNMFGSMFGAPMGPNQGGHAQPGLPPGLAGLFASLLNPANARSGDAVYTQEALDNIISQLMEQNTSNAPGPATEEAIAALPKKKLDEKMLGPEGKGECSVCMDDVTIGDEVVQLPCTHWFHQQCAGIWLKEHNTCPICRKGIDGNTQSTGGGSGQGQSQSQSQRSPLFGSAGRRLSQIHRPSSTATGTHSPANARRLEPIPMNAAAEAEQARRRASRLEAIRNIGGRSADSDNVPRTTNIIRIQVVGDGSRYESPNTSRRSSRTGRPREERRHSERSHEPRRHEIQQPPLPPRRTSTSASHTNHNGGSITGSAIGWLRDRFTNHGTPSSSRRRN